jgi:hypothetical protein
MANLQRLIMPRDLTSGLANHSMRPVLVVRVIMGYMAAAGAG